ncbi:MAG: efflux RND transporter permease subunit [Geitlerinemataceae cyanobacterium]
MPHSELPPTLRDPERSPASGSSKPPETAAPARQPSNGISITTLAIRRAVGTLILTVAVVVLGLFVVVRMPVDLLPSIVYPRIGLRLDVPGVMPSVAVNDITRPLEEAMAATEGVEQLLSQTREGRISLDLFFRAGDDIDRALNDATAALNRVRDRLPEAAGEPRLFRFDPSQLPVYELALTSQTLSLVDLRIFADEELARELTRVPGVANVDISGGVREEVQVNLDLDRLQAVGLDVQDVLNAIDDRNLDTAGGFIRGGEAESLARVTGQFASADEIRRLPLSAARGSAQLVLEDVATVRDGTEEQRIFVSLDGTPAVKVSIQKQADANSIATVDGVKARLDDLRKAGLIADDMTLQVMLDESVFIRDSIADVVRAGATGAALAGAVVLLFLGSLRQTVTIVLAIPLATLVAMLLMGIFGLSLNVFSLGGLALGVGIVVDNTIVMLEAIATEDPDELGGEIPRDPQSFQERAEARSRDLESALLASTTTNLVSVMPFLMLGGFMSLLFGELILTISFAVAASLPIALTVVPALAVRLLSVQKSSGFSSWWPIRRFQRALSSLTQLYTRALSGLLRFRLLTVGFTVALLATTSIWAVGQLPQEILPRIGNGRASMFAQFPPGTTLEDNRRIMAEVDRLLLSQPDVTSTFNTSGGFLFGSITIGNALRGTSSVNFRPGTNVPAAVERLSAMLEEEIPLVGVTLRMFPSRVRGLILNNSPTRGDIDIVLQGTDPDALATGAEMVSAALDDRATLARYRPDAAPPQPEVRIFPDWQRAAELGLSAREIGETVETALSGSVATLFQRDDRLIDVRVQLAPGSISQPDRLRDIPLFTDENRLVRLGDIATIGTGAAPGEIQRINQRQVAIFDGSLTDGANLSDALAETQAIVDSLDLPEGVSMLPSAAAETSQQLQNSLRLLGGLAAFLVFVVMAVQYDSLCDPLVILLTVPLAVAGAIFGLYVTQTAIGATVLIGIVLLVGIVVNNAIVLVERANQLREREAVSARTAMIRAASQRLRPILMTTITTVLGLLPLAWQQGGGGARFLQPLGVVVFSGLSLATLLTLFIVPCFYTLFHRDSAA